MIPLPRLDDRNYEDIVAEALRLIPRYCPDWTNHNPSDPGVTILELAAWMTEIMLFRINRVPEKNYLAFLNMLGINLRLPQPARALLTFEIAQGGEQRVLLRRGAQVATQQASDDETVVFETQRDLVLSSSKIDRCFSYANENFSDNTAFLNGSVAGGFEPFGAVDRIDRFIYVGDSRLQIFSEASMLRLHLNCPDHGGRDLARLLEWEYFNGRRWRELRMMGVEVERGEVVFRGPADFAQTEVNGLKSYWIRGRLAEVPNNAAETEIDTIKAILEVAEEGAVPDRAFSNLEGGAFVALDLGKNIHPLGQTPKIDQCLYVASRELFAQPGAEIRLEIAISDTNVAPLARASEDLVLSWEYFDGKKWRRLGRSGPKGNLPTPENPWKFIDGTSAFTQSGVVAFSVPTDIHAGEINGEDNYWIRARLDQGDYGQAGSYVLEEDKWVWRDDRPLRPPAIKSLSLFSRFDLQYLRNAISYNDFRYRDHSEEIRQEYRPFQPFSPIVEEGAAFYLGWNNRLPNDPMSLYVLLAETPFRPAQDGRSNIEYLRSWYAERDAVWEAEQRVVWEYYDGKKWTLLSTVDGTKNFTQSGFVEFVGPEDHARSLKFAEERFWLRARLEMGGYVRAPRVLRILTNTVEAANMVTMENEVLGSSDASPTQFFQFAQSPLLENEVIEVLEKDEPRPEEIADLGADAVRRDAEVGFWVRWRCVDNLFDSGPTSRHYTRDWLSGTISFGDGIRGKVPPEGRNNVVARRYHVGGGIRGNVNSMTITQLTRAIAYIEKCYNLLPASGGADPETIEEAKMRAPLMLKSGNRAVTSEDFEALALEASTGVARVKCLPSPEKDGFVQVVVVPRGDDQRLDLTRKLVPAPELLRYVKNFLDERRLIGTLIEVTRPNYVEISLKITLVRRTIGPTDRLKREIEERLRFYLHPLIGGRDGQGWQFGRAVYKTDLTHIVEDISGIERIDAVAIFDEDRRVAVEYVRLEPDELIHLVNVVVVERVREEIV